MFLLSNAECRDFKLIYSFIFRPIAWIATSGRLLLFTTIGKCHYKSCIFPRQSWIDKRLAFKDSTNNITTLALSISMLKKIWKPDTFFFNGKQV